MTGRELLVALLDLRTRSCSHLSAAEKARSIELFLKEYVAFARRAEEYEQEIAIAETAEAAKLGSGI